MARIPGRFHSGIDRALAQVDQYGYVITGANGGLYQGDIVLGLGQDQPTSGITAPPEEEKKPWWERGLIWLGENIIGPFIKEKFEHEAKMNEYERLSVAQQLTAEQMKLFQELRAYIDGMNFKFMMGGIAILGIGGYLIIKSRK